MFSDGYLSFSGAIGHFLALALGTPRYMADYESTAFMSLERLKEQHGEELSNFQELIRCLAVETSLILPHSLPLRLNLVAGVVILGATRIWR